MTRKSAPSEELFSKAVSTFLQRRSSERIGCNSLSFVMTSPTEISTLLDCRVVLTAVQRERAVEIRGVGSCLLLPPVLAWREEDGSTRDPSGVYICKSIVNDLRHGNFICKS